MSVNRKATVPLGMPWRSVRSFVCTAPTSFGSKAFLWPGAPIVRHSTPVLATPIVRAKFEPELATKHSAGTTKSRPIRAPAVDHFVQSELKVKLVVDTRFRLVLQ